MKALKEKRVSLRSLMRRGLVILSLFALVFASCSDSDSGTDPTGGTDGTTPPPSKTVTAIQILRQPVNESYQGFAPDLTGLIAEVFWSDGTSETVLGESGKFTTSPGYCDEAWPGTKSTSDPSKYGDGTDPYTKLSLQYIGQAALASGLEIPMVVGATKIDITGVPKPWYADERPNFDGLAYEISYDTGWLGLGSKSVAGVPNKYSKQRAAMTPVYPHVNYADAASQNKLTVYVGPAKLNGGVEASTATVDARALSTNMATGTFQVPGYYGVADIAYKGADWGNYFDDDISRFFVDFPGNTSTLDPSKVYAELRKSNVKFEVTYIGTDRKKEIDVDTFIGNSVWYWGLYSVQGITSAPLGGGAALGTLIQGHDGVTQNKTAGWASTLVVGADQENEANEYSWRIRLDYAPWNFGYSAAYTNVWVPIPIYEFDELFVVKSAAGAVTLTAPINNNTSLMNDDEFKAIKGKWALEGVYVLGNAQARKTIELTKQMFYDGYYGASAGTYGVTSLNTSYNNESLPPKGGVFGKNVSALGHDSLGTSQNTQALNAGQFRENYKLPVYYRGQLINDEDDGITVELKAVN